MTDFPGIIIFEGADAAGKTTLAKHLMKQVSNGVYLHLSYNPNIWPIMRDTVFQAVEHFQKGKLVLIDRHWPSELAYGKVYRGDSVMPYTYRALEAILARYCALYVWCIPSDVEAQIERHRRLHEEGREMYDDISRVIDLYGIMWSDRRDDRNCFRYDLTMDQMSEVTRRLFDWVERLYETQPGHFLTSGSTNLTGHLYHTQTVLVGDKLSPRAVKPCYPFLDIEGTSSAYLYKALECAGVKQLDLLMTNINEQDDGDFLRMLVERQVARSLKFITLGDKAAASFNKRFPSCPFTPLHHPQWEKRFNSKNFRRYSDELKEHCL